MDSRELMSEQQQDYANELDGLITKLQQYTDLAEFEVTVNAEITDANGAPVTVRLPATIIGEEVIRALRAYSRDLRKT